MNYENTMPLWMGQGDGTHTRWILLIAFDSPILFDWCLNSVDICLQFNNQLVTLVSSSFLSGQTPRSWIHSKVRHVTASELYMKNTEIL